MIGAAAAAISLRGAGTGLHEALVEISQEAGTGLHEALIEISQEYI